MINIIFKLRALAILSMILIVISLLWALLEIIFDGAIVPSHADTVIAIILSVSIWMNVEYCVLLRKDVHRWSNINLFGHHLLVRNSKNK